MDADRNTHSFTPEAPTSGADPRDKTLIVERPAVRTLLARFSKESASVAATSVRRQSTPTLTSNRKESHRVPLTPGVSHWSSEAASLVLERQSEVCYELFGHPAAQHRGRAKGGFRFRNARRDALAQSAKALPCTDGIQ